MANELSHASHAHSTHMFSHHVSINFVRRLSAAAAFRYLLTGFPAETLKRMAHPTPGGPLAAGGNFSRNSAVATG